MLDAAKAFDRVHYCKLFNVLIDKNLPFVTLRLLLNMYTSHVTKVLWNDNFSCSFLVMNVVKQGGIVSPLLLCVYLDGLLELLKESQVGCYVGNLCVAALAYADDIALLAYTARAKRELLNICDNLAIKFDVVFNASKSQCLVFKPFIGRNMATEWLSSKNSVLEAKR